MARVAVTELQRRGAINNGWGLYNLKAGWSGSVRYGLPAVKAGMPYYAPDWNPPHTPRGDVFHGRGLAPIGLGSGCPEGSHLVNGECVCYEGRVWMPDHSKCVSPQAPSYTGAVSIQEQQASSTTPISQQPLTEAAKAYLKSKGYTVNCAISTNWFVGPQGGVPPMLCSINGGPYEHAAYSINANPYNVVATLEREAAVNKVSQATGIAPGSLYTTPETIAAVDKTMVTGAVAPADAATAKAASDAKAQLQSSLVAGVDYDVATGAPLSWKAEVAGSNRVTYDLIQEALRLPAGAQVSSTGGVMTQDGSVPSDSGIGFSDSGIPWWVWAAGAGAAYFMFKGK